MFRHLIRRVLPLALVFALLLTMSFGSSDEASAAGETNLGRAIAAQNANTNALMAIDGVIGTAVGRGTGGGHVVLALTTAGGVRGIPGAVDGVIVRPYVTGEIVAQPRPGSGVDRTARFARPVPIGISVGHTAITAGTVGARVIDANGDIFALSNNHVFANENLASPGDPVIQPGTFDGGSSPADDLGTLSSFVPIVFSTSASNVVDAAIAATTADDLDTDTPSDGYGTPSSTTVGASVGQNVRKYGRTTGQTDGQVDAINATVNVGYDSGTARFVGQVLIKGKKGSFSDGGDSGSVIVTKDGSNPVALLFAGSNSVTIGNPIDAVLSALSVTIDDGNGPPTTPNNAPVVNISSPLDASAYEVADSITFTGIASDTEDAGLGAGNLAWSSNIDGNIGSGATFSRTLSSGAHTITASATDSGGKTGSDSVSVVVTDPNAATMSVGSISFTESSRGRHTDLSFTVVIVDSGGTPVAGAAVTSVLSRSGASWDFNGTTNSSGSISGKLRSARVGSVYTETVTGVTHGSFVFVDGPSSSASWLVGGPN